MDSKHIRSVFNFSLSVVLHMLYEYLINGENRIQDLKRGEGDKVILNEFEIADFPETLDHIP